MVSDHRLDDQKYEFSSALWGTRNVSVFFLFLFLWPICYTSNFPVFNQIQCKCELLDHSNDWLFLKSATFCMNYAIFWAKLEVMVITLEPRTSNIAGSSCKYTNGFFICFYIRSTAFNTTGHVSSRSDCILNFYWRPIHFLIPFSRH